MGKGRVRVSMRKYTELKVRYKKESRRQVGRNEVKNVQRKKEREREDGRRREREGTGGGRKREEYG
jgi:hypothetical protein